MLRSKRVIMLLVLGVALAIPAIALADPRGYVLHPSDPSYGYVRDNWEELYGCDLDIDGHRVRLHYLNAATTNPENYRITDFAPSQGCETPDRSWVRITAVRVCVEHEGCSPWKR
jgi:hypothetical protein